MNDYFDHVERSLRRSVRERGHLPWYARLLSRRSRPALVAVVVLLGGGTALAATGVLRIGASVGNEVQPTPSAGDGTVIASSVRLLPLRVSDPGGGPPWGLRVARTSRGLLCVEVGRVVDGRLGVLGRDGAFADDGAFHPFSRGYLSGVGCATEDGRGDGFVNVQLHGTPASGLLSNRRYASGGCYAASSSGQACPPSELRDVYFGMLGPDARAITTRTAAGGGAELATARPYGGYLVVLPHREGGCRRGMLSCSAGDHYYTFSPTLPANEAIAAVDYAGRAPCRLPQPGAGRGLAPEASCPDVGFVAPRRARARLTAAELASPVDAHLVRASRYCERGEAIVPCDHAVPHGYRPMREVRGAPPEVLLVVEFTARQAVTDFDSHYEIETTIPREPRHPGFQEDCGGTAGPTQTNLRAGQHVRYTTFLGAGCRGTTRVTVGYVTVDGPSSATPVPGLPGQSRPIPVGRTTIELR